jgi:drug/metabolite transporter (DMT)-like permease
MLSTVKVTMPETDPSRRPIGIALLAALLFGVTTPAAKALLSESDPWLLAGLLYMGSGVGLGGVRLFMRVLGRTPREAPLRRSDVPWLAGAIVCGGGIGPGLLMLGLAGSSASQVSLLLNLEGVLTALLAWFVFREHFDARIALGMGVICSGAFVLAWRPDHGIAFDRSALFVAAGCLAWAADNNFTRKVSGGDAVVIAILKGVVAGTVNLLIASARGAPWPRPSLAVTAGIVGLLGYGVSLVLFVWALRALGAARTGAYFSTAPFLGSVLAIITLGEPLSGRLAVAGLLMGAGVWLHLSERHAHHHTHDSLSHEHLHRHDAHHDHAHAPGLPLGEPHSHWHVHAPTSHAHRHYPDLHHGHPH